MRADRCLTLSLFEPLRRAGVGGRQKYLPILMYHTISEDPETDVHPYYRLATSPARFAQQMQWLADESWIGVSLEAALQRIADGQDRDRRTVAITFDDGFRDFHLEAWPVLQQHGFTATMYLPTAFVGSQRKSFLGRECLTWDEVRSMRREGIRFGSHTVNHAKLHALPWAQIEQELRLSKERIATELGEEVVSFGYPYAYPREDAGFVSQFTALLQKWNYQSCVTTVIGRAPAGSNPFELRRLPVNSADDRALFGAKLEGAYDWLSGVQSWFRRAKNWKRSAQACVLPGLRAS